MLIDQGTQQGSKIFKNNDKMAHLYKQMSIFLHIIPILNQVQLVYPHIEVVYFSNVVV